MMTHRDDSTSLLLVVDDEEGMRETLRDILEECDFAADTASNGLEAVDKVKTVDYDLVLMDVRMPVMGGIEALRNMRRLRPGLPIIMMTAYSSTSAETEACREGAQMMLYKPVDLDELLGSIRSAPQLDKP